HRTRWLRPGRCRTKGRRPIGCWASSVHFRDEVSRLGGTQVTGLGPPKVPWVSGSAGGLVGVRPFVTRLLPTVFAFLLCLDLPRPAPLLLGPFTAPAEEVLLLFPRGGTGPVRVVVVGKGRLPARGDGCGEGLPGRPPQQEPEHRPDLGQQQHHEDPH